MNVELVHAETADNNITLDRDASLTIDSDMSLTIGDGVSP
jgi:hypothetical protein